MSTSKAPFGRGIPFVNLGQGPPIPRRFVFQLPDKFTPSDIVNGLRQTVIFDHVLDRQTLTAYDLVLAYDLSRELVLIIPSSVGYPLVETRNLQTGFIAVLGAVALFRMMALCPRQLLFITRKELGVAIGLPIRSDHIVS